MIIALKKNSDAFRTFINSQSRHIIFTSVFYALWLAKDVAQHQDFELHSFAGRMIGIATVEGYDVGARSFVFYKCLGIFLSSFFIFTLLGYSVFKKSPLLLVGVETRIINYTSLAGILLCLFRLFSYDVSETTEFLYAIHKLMLAAVFLRLLFFKKMKPTLYQYTLLMLSSVSVYFLVSDCFVLSGTGLVPDFFLTAFLIFCTALICLGFLLRDKLIAQPIIDKMAYCLLPLALLPFLSILKDELFLIFRNRQLSLHPSLIYVMLLLLLSGLIALRHRRYEKKERRQLKELISLCYFPLFIFSIVSYCKYAHYAIFSEERFELGNTFLPIMEFKLFDVIPTLEKFNSHLLSDYFFCAVYTIINGLKEFEMTLYDFLNFSIAYALYYYLVLYLSRNAFIALFCVLIFPLFASMLPHQFSFGIFALFALHQILSRPPSAKNYIVFFATLSGLILWRIDLGYSCLVVMPALLLYYHFRSKTFSIQPRLLVKSALWVTGALLLVIVGFCIYRGQNLFEKIPYALNYLSSAQTYGYMQLGEPEQLAYKVHYFLFPALAGIILIALVMKFRSLNRSRGQRLAYLGLLFMCAFYFVNFNRGLVRHGLIEMTDHFTSSYIYIIVPGAFLVFFQQKTQAFRFVGLVTISFFLLSYYKVPDPSGSKSFFETMTEAGRRRDSTDLYTIVSRKKFEPGFKNNKDSLFIAFINKHTLPGETFIDFSNNPMFYFYTKKITPSYFYQNPLCSHNEFLQKRFIADLTEYNTPYVSFSTDEPVGMDIVDGVPNYLRHYRIAEHFYTDYMPFITAGRIRVWKGKSVRDINKKDTLYAFTNQGASSAEPVLRTTLNFKPGKKYLAKCVLTEASDMTLKTVFEADSANQIPEWITSTLAYWEIQPKGHGCTLELQNINNTAKTFQVIECDYLPDIAAEKFVSINFSKLPYIWGTYDKTLSAEPVLLELPGLQLQKNTAQAFNIPKDLSRINGNTVIITCKNNSGAGQEMSLSFGNSKDKNRTKISFQVMPSGKEERYAIRVSSLYKWYSDTVDELSLSTDSNNLTISSIKITRGI